MICIFYVGIKFRALKLREDFLPTKFPTDHHTVPVRDNNNHAPYAIAYSLEATRNLIPRVAVPWLEAPWGRGWAARLPPIEITKTGRRGS